MTTKVGVIVLAAIVLATTLVAAEFNDVNLYGAYSQIDALLAKKLPKTFDNIPLSLEKAASLLKKEEGWHIFRKKRSMIITALRSLLDLKIIDGSEACSDRAYKTLLKNDRITEGRAHTGWELSPASRRSHIDSIVHYYSVKHAKKCLTTHVRTFDIAHDRIPKSSVEAIEPFLNKVVFRHLCGFVPSAHNMDDCNLEPEHIATKLPTIKVFEPADAPLILEELDLITRGKPEELRLQKAVKIRDDASQIELTQMVNRYLVPLCRDYYETLKNVFVPAQYDYMMLESKIHDKDMTDFLLGWANYRLCTAMLDNPAVLSKFVHYSDL